MDRKIKLFFLSLVFSALHACVSTPEAETAAIPTGSSYVQAGTFAVPANASRRVARLLSLGYVADTVHSSIRGKAVEFVRIHDLKELDALSICYDLKANGIDCFINARRTLETNSNYASSYTKPITTVLTEA